MITMEQRSQAEALQRGLAFAGQKKAAIAALTVNFPSGKHRFCQYPADTFCLFREDANGEWLYESCSCDMEQGDEAEPLHGDQIVRFPDFFDRYLYFVRYGDRVALFVNQCFKGFLTSASTDDDDLAVCALVHTNTLGWDGKGNDSDTDDSDKDTWTVQKDDDAPDQSEG